MQLSTIYTDVKMYGFSSSIDKVEGFDRNLKSAKISGRASQIFMTGNYEIKGQLLLLPIQGKGQFNMTVYGVDAYGKYKFGIFKKNNKEILQATKVLFNMDEPKKVSVYFDNLFGGNKLLGESMNQFLNENWREIFNEFKVALNPKFGELCLNLMNSVFGNFDYHELFIE